MNDIARSLRAQFSGVEMPASIPVVRLDLQTTDRFRLSLWLLLGSVFLILLIACINVSGLLLARGSARERESQSGARSGRRGLPSPLRSLPKHWCSRRAAASSAYRWRYWVARRLGTLDPRISHGSPKRGSTGPSCCSLRALLWPVGFPRAARLELTPCWRCAWIELPPVGIPAVEITT